MGQTNIANLEDARAELTACAINVDYALDQSTLDTFAALVRVFEDLSHSAAIWDITSSVGLESVRDRTVASEALTRTPVSLSLATSELIDSTYNALRFPNANGDDIDIYPGFVMTQSKNGDFALIDIRELQVTHRGTQFVEEETVPADGEIVGQTWKKTNKDGTPDKRFADNYAIPMVKYGQLWITSPTGLKEAYMFSNFSNAERFTASFSNYRRQLNELARTSRVAPADPPDPDLPEEIPDAPVAPTAIVLPRPKWLFLDWIVLLSVLGLVGFVAVRTMMLVNSHPATTAPTTSEPAITPSAPPPTSVPVPSPASRPALQKTAPEPSQTLRPLNLSPPPAKSAREATFVQKANVNLRSAPSPSAGIVSVTSKGKQFSVFAREGEWVQVGETAPVGWIHNSMLAPTMP